MPLVAELETLPVDQARTGDEGAWRVLFKRYRLPIYAYVFELVREEQASLDLVQETFIRAVRHLGNLRENHKFGGWLFGIAHRLCVDRWRRLGRETSAEELVEIADDDDEPPGMVLVREERAAEFQRLLGELPEPQRAVLLLHFIEEFSLEEIARITDARLGTVKSRLHYAKKALRQLWEEHEK